MHPSENLRLTDSHADSSYGSVTPEISRVDAKKGRWTKMVMLGMILVLATGLVAGGAIYYQNSLRVHDAAVTDPVPGMNSLDRAYNLFRGKFFDTAYSHGIGSFSYPSSPGSNDMIQAGSRSYLKPTMVDVTQNLRCERRGSASGVAKTASTSDLKMEGDSQSYGYDSTTTISASMPVGSGEVGAERELRTAVLFGNSNEMMESESRSTQEYSYHSQAAHEARVYYTDTKWAERSYGFSFNSDFVRRLQQVGSYSSVYDRNKKVFQFFKDYGSHVVKKAVFGSRCYKSAYYKAGYESDSKSKASTTASNNEIDIFGFKYGSSSSSSTSSKTDSSTGVTYQQTSETCLGVLENNACNRAQDAVSLQPIIMQAEPLPVWELPVSGVGTSVRNAFESGINSLLSEWKRCNTAVCNARGMSGICRRLKDSFWTNVVGGSWDGVFRTSYFESDCVCKTGVAPDCRPEPKTCPGYQLMGSQGTCGVKKGYAYATTSTGTCRDTLRGFVNGGNYERCHFNLCERSAANYANGFGLGSSSDCQGSSKRNYYMIVTAKASECIDAGGGYNGSPGMNDYISCHFWLCNNARYYPAGVGTCPGGTKKFYGIITATLANCRSMGGAWNGSPGANDWIACHLDFCDSRCKPTA